MQKNGLLSFLCICREGERGMLLTKFHFEICRANILCFTKTEFSFALSGSGREKNAEKVKLKLEGKGRWHKHFEQ